MQIAMALCVGINFGSALFMWSEKRYGSASYSFGAGVFCLIAYVSMYL